jgi:hypothetical protein
LKSFLDEEGIRRSGAAGLSAARQRLNCENVLAKSVANDPIPEVERRILL